MTIWPLLRRIGIAAAAVISLGLLLLYTTPAGNRARVYAAETLVVTRYQPKIWLLVGHRRSEQIIEEFRAKGISCYWGNPYSTPSAAAASTPSLKTTLSAADGRRMNVFLAAPDERKEAAEGDSCMAAANDTLRSGSYRLYLQAESASAPIEQETAPWANADKLTFNDSRAVWTVLPNKSGTWPSDLLVLHQYGDCNGSSLYVFGLSSDGSRLIDYSFVENGASPHPSLYAHTLEVAAADNDGYLWSRTYDNARGASYSILWSVDPIHQQLSGTSYGPDAIPPASDSNLATGASLTAEAKLAIAKQLLQGFLQERQRAGVTDDRRIKDFHIKDIRLDSLQAALENGSGFQIYTQYEILPDSSSFVLAGNGQIRDDGWVVDVSRYIRVAESNSSYFIACMGTGP